MRAGCCANFSPLPLSIPLGNSFSSFNIELMQRLCRLQATISPSRGMDPAARCGFGTWRRWSGRFHFKITSVGDPKTFRVLSRSCNFRTSSLHVARKSVPFGKYSRTRPLVCSFKPRSQEWKGEKEICVKCDTPVVCELLAVVIVWTNSAPEPSRRIIPTVSFCPPSKVYFVARATRQLHCELCR